MLAHFASGVPSKPSGLNHCGNRIIGEQKIVLQLIDADPAIAELLAFVLTAAQASGSMVRCAHILPDFTRLLRRQSRRYSHWRLGQLFRVAGPEMEARMVDCLPALRSQKDQPRFESRYYRVPIQPPTIRKETHYISQ